jgi:hypothetical protein
MENRKQEILRNIEYETERDKYIYRDRKGDWDGLRVSH